MNYFNLYFKGRKLNNRPVTDEEISEIKKKKEIYKRNNITNNLEKISINEIQYVKTILI